MSYITYNEIFRINYTLLNHNILNISFGFFKLIIYFYLFEKKWMYLNLKEF